MAGLPETAVELDAAAGPSPARGGVWIHAHQRELMRLVRPASRAPAQRVLAAVTPKLSWQLCQGRLSTLEGQARLTLAFLLVRQAQQQGEPALWVAAGAGDFFPPDAAAAGVRLDWLPVVRAGDLTAGLRAAELGLRSGAFGLVVVDAGDDPGGAEDGGAVFSSPAREHGPWSSAVLPLPVQARLLGLAQQHGAAVVLLTASARRLTAQGSLCSLGLQSELRPVPPARGEGATRREPGWFLARVRASKDKHGPPGWIDEVLCRGPEGLR